MQGFVKDTRDAINFVVENMQAVRKVARGTFEIPATKSGDIVVSLSGFVNADKMVVLLNGSSNRSGDTISYNWDPYVKSLTTTSLTIAQQAYSSSSGVVGTGSYQVIEFY